MVLLVVAAGSANAAQGPVTPRAFHSTSAVYSQKKVRACLEAQSLTVSVDTLQHVRSYLVRYDAFPPGLTGQTTLIGTGTPALGGGKSPPGVDLGRAIDDVNLLFFRTPALARAGVEKVVGFYVYGGGWPIFAPPPPPASKAATFLSQAGNVLALWHYPQHHPALDDRVFWKCLANSRG